MSKALLALENQFHDGIYYRKGDTGVFPDDFEPKIGKNGKKKWISVGEASPELAKDEKSRTAQKAIDELAKKHKLDPDVLEGLYREKNAESTEDKLKAVEWLVKELAKGGSK